ncbi:DEAD/DEAH box helicase [Plectosphaerella plurivora]|uniref:ATP-dependent RNA helicase n=1 Tax=Plectosphaerella plurivora TaxID=936078 RepID=A0A9P8V3X3_9PEZI|nr:DEAD/DEAH box helicase [Plectosphaerella plurivora]
MAKRKEKQPPPLKRDVRQEKRKQVQESLVALEKAIEEFSRAIPLALKGSDILGAAKTGSGKTLAFIIPVLEKLYRARWTEYDGLGALIISPTRELAAQIFEVLRKVGRSHNFSAGLVIGGKNLKEEAERLAKMNILVCTPGRMLQHLDQTAGFDVDNLQILVLDEADRIMDMGFQSAVDALVEHLPTTRQTLLFSATQSKKISDLARLSLKEPEYVSVHEETTPKNLQQHYIVTPLPEKLDTLYGFIKANLKSKMIVFFSSGKQVRFVYESFRHLSPGVPLLHLLGKQKQVQRMEITRRFAEANHSCLFATDVVARGVDFPAVDWVVQVDCPEDVDTYIHRVGRTARYERDGKAVLFLDPSEEEGMLKRLEHKKVPIQKINVKESKKRSVRDQLQSMCFQYPDLKYLGQKAFISYARSIYLQGDKEVFHFDKQDLDGFSASMGLPGAPQIKFRKGEDVKRIKNAPRGNMSSDDDESEYEADGTAKPKKEKKKKNEVKTKYDRMFERTNQDVLSAHYTKVLGEDGEEVAAVAEDDDDGDFLSVKRVLQGDELDLAPELKIKKIQFGDQEYIIDSKRREKALMSKKKMLKFKGTATKLIFDEDGVGRPLYELQDEKDFAASGPAEEQRQRFVEGEAEKVKEADEDDKQLAKDKRREKRLKRKAREAEENGDMPRAGRSVEAAGGSVAADALALLASLPTSNNGYKGAESSDESEEDERPAKKKAKKWFQKDDEEEEKETGGKRVYEIAEAPETLEDLEALATGLLDD